MAEWRTKWRNGGMAGMAGMAERQKERQNGKMTEVATYVLFMVHADDTLIFYIMEFFMFDTSTKS
jgi:hypothetical protein